MMKLLAPMAINQAPRLLSHNRQNDGLLLILLAVSCICLFSANTCHKRPNMKAVSIKQEIDKPQEN
jgi:hypothetical protein